MMMSKMQRLWRAMSVGGGTAATPMSTIVIGFAMFSLANPGGMLDKSEGEVQFLALGYLGLFSLFTLIGAVFEWRRTRPARARRPQHPEREAGNR